MTVHFCYGLAGIFAMVLVWALVKAAPGVRAELQDCRGEGGSGPVR